MLLLTGGWNERAVAGKLRGGGRSKTWQVEAACGNVEMVVFPFSLNKMSLDFHEHVPVVAVYAEVV